ncbi:ribonuclease III [Moraxella nasibovis]|uniref:ribonuclease III n=1 Tax=Moraxella nasibovis TaxID=2904120 RepID=UPI00240F389D|nr:ribonuclease III [Moraxella nasibovis]WFF38545.1 ribonuclease III [Moraxella nasibovis]
MTDSNQSNAKAQKISALDRQPHFASFEQGLPVLFDKLGYVFKDVEHLRRALTHRSYNPKASYERLEFLGDALLGMVIAEALFLHFPRHDEGKLTRMRATLVRQETLVQIAEQLELSRHLILGVGERKGGGRHRASILADAVEAVVAAVYLDSNDMNLVKELIKTWYESLILEVGEEKVLKDAKSRLQEWLQGNRMALPTYELDEIIGNAPNQTFVVTCRVNLAGIDAITQTGESRRIAEQKCAELMINQLNKTRTTP